jgi:WD40 repeat protein
MSSSWSDVSSTKGNYIKASWHSQYPILASSTQTSIEFFDQAGEKRERTLQKDNATSGLLAWHPSKKLLATSWSNGALVIWNESEKAARDAIGHDCVINTLTWSPNGHRLVTGDAVLFTLILGWKSSCLAM